MGRIAALWALGAVCHCAWASPPHKHEHGVASLQVAVDGASLDVTFSTPLDNLLGFEHAPRTDAQRQAMRAWTARLQRPDTLFVPSPAAACSLESSRLDAPLLTAAAGRSLTDVSSAKESKADRQVSSGAHPDPSHAHLEASLSFRCRYPERLRGLDAVIFEAAPRLRRIDAQLAGPKGQSAARLTPSRRTFAW